MRLNHKKSYVEPYPRVPRAMSHLVLYGLYGTIGAKWTDFAILAQFDQVLLIKSRILVHFLVKLIYGSFWEILSCPSLSIGDLWGL